MSVASNVTAIWKERSALPRERVLLAGIVCASVLLVLVVTAVPVWTYFIPSPNSQAVVMPSVTRSLPHIPNMLLGELTSQASEVVSTETYLFNFRANSFKYLSYAGVSSSQLRKSFDVLMLPIRHRLEFLAALSDEARIQNVHPCFVSAVLQAPFSSGLQAPVPVTSLLAVTPAEAFSRAAVTEIPVDSYAELATPDTAARIAVRYIKLLQEIYPSQGNIVVLAFWSDVDAMKARLGGELPFEVQDLELLQSSVATYGRCLADPA